MGDGVGEFVGEEGGEAGFGGTDGEDAWGGEGRGFVNISGATLGRGFGARRVVWTYR